MPVLNKDVREQLFTHIKLNAIRNKILIDSINGHTDHVHCLICLRPTQSVSEVAKLLKGESARWLNTQNYPGYQKFYWQEEYFAVSVSESFLPGLRIYINNQELHHQKQSFDDEYSLFMRKYNFSTLSRD